MGRKLIAWTLIAAAVAVAGAPLGTYTAAERRHWSFQARSNPPAPSFASATDKTWASGAVDAFVLSRMKKEGLSPSLKADRATLIRRVTFDLTGIPPTPAETAAFLNDKSPKAWGRVVDRLLASEHYGEHWGKHWLDVVRFSETEGFEYDNYRPDAWRYRDYVIRAFNNDKPFDRFIQEQIAGDEIAPKEHESLIAGGFNRLGPIRRNAGNQLVASSRNEQLTEMTNIVGTGILGVTLGCARCHDHKFDGFRQTDYYRMQAFFAALQADDPITVPDAEQKAWKEKATPVEQEVGKLTLELNKLTKAGMPTAEIQAKLNEAQARMPAPLPSLFTVKDDFAKKADIRVLPRGDYEHPGEPVGMRFPGVLLGEDAPELSGDLTKPRETLATWLTEAKNPLTARVMVNRIWEYTFGRGIVATPNDFGRMGERPVNPELLDWLANDFVAGGWSVKRIQRTILLSNTYQQSSATVSPKDPDSRYLSRFPRQRLDAEEIRDSMLAVAGRLNEKKGGPGVTIPLDPALVQAMYKPSQWVPAKDAAEYDRRSVYLFAKRNMELPFMQVFDAPDSTISCPRRESSTHAPQALEMLNGELSNQMARAFGDRLVKDAGASAERQVRLAYQLAAGRPPRPQELKMGAEFLSRGGAKARGQFALAMFNLNAFLYVN
jgi:hypothetical protein